jgi:hypothetical protein
MLGKNMKFKHLFQSAVITVGGLAIMSCSGGKNTETTSPPPETLPPNHIQSTELIQRGEAFYEKFSDTPFTGKVIGREQGAMKNGIREGNWLFYYESGQLLLRVHYINGKKSGEETTYYENGTILSKGEYQDDKRVLPTWKIYDESGNLIL